MTNSYHTVICSVTRGLVEGPDRQCTPCVMLPTNPAPYTIVEWGIQTARYNMYRRLAGIGDHTVTLYLEGGHFCYAAIYLPLNTAHRRAQ